MIREKLWYPRNSWLVNNVDNFVFFIENRVTLYYFCQFLRHFVELYNNIGGEINEKRVVTGYLQHIIKAKQGPTLKLMVFVGIKLSCSRSYGHSQKEKNIIIKKNVGVNISQ